VPTKEEVVDALRAVEDPELGMDIVELGLLYDVEVEGPKVKVIHTLTSMGCPVGPMIQENIDQIARAIPDVEDVEVELTWDPPWSPEKMSVCRPSFASRGRKTRKVVRLYHRFGAA
jgi:metal-sulfur cluster biosynthetic enzyme